MRCKCHARSHKRQDLSQPRLYIRVSFLGSLDVRTIPIGLVHSPRKFLINVYLPKYQAYLRSCSGTPRSLSVLSAAARLSCLNSFVMSSPDSPTRSVIIAARSGHYSAESFPDRIHLFLLMVNRPLGCPETREMAWLSHEIKLTGRGF